MSNQHSKQWPSQEKDASLTDPEEPDWEVISHSDLYDECRSHPHNGGASASGSIKVGFGENKKEVFSFHFHTRGKCEGCRKRHESGGRTGEVRDGWEDETVVGDDEGDDVRRGGEQRGGTVLEGKGFGAT